MGLLSVAARLLERRGFFCPAETMEDFLKQGRLAIFFDGLDEVVSVEKRAIVVQHINELVTKALPLGNRIVVTSRPAVVNVVNLLPSLHQLELQGLTEGEIHTLATRILALKLSETGEQVIVDQRTLKTTDSAVVTKLVEDCADKPGVARLAQNPLLLTLLVMIYANSGAPSAKRHLIYEEAIKTLAAVRGRQADMNPVFGSRPARERLGAVALSVYRKESGFLPTRAEVAQTIRCVMKKTRSGDVPLLEADTFVQKVAESTGLIAIGGQEGKTDGGRLLPLCTIVSWNISAAIGLSKELDRAWTLFPCPATTLA